LSKIVIITKQAVILHHSYLLFVIMHSYYRVFIFWFIELIFHFLDKAWFLLLNMKNCIVSLNYADVQIVADS